MNTTAAVGFAVIIALCFVVVYVASKRNVTTDAHYVAGGQIKGWQNGLAISGDFLSAGAFLGIAGGIAMAGYRGFYLATAYAVGLLVLILLLAEPLRNLGKYTMADVLASRFNSSSVRSIAALNTLTISLVYLIAQLVGAGAVITLLLGIDYPVAVIAIGVLITIYVAGGGMLATTWIQMGAAVLLVAGGFAMALAVLLKFDFSLVALFNGVSAEVGEQALTPPAASTLTVLGLVSLSMAAVFGIGGLPHILIRFLTVPDAKAARSSVITATWVICAFFMVTPIIGYGAALIVGQEAIAEANPAGNLAAPQLAVAVGGSLFLAFIAAAAFAAIISTVVGLVIAASGAFAHDFYTNVLRGGEVGQREQFRAARITSVVITAAAIVLSLGAQNFNVAFTIALAFAIAASANFPVLILTIFWRGFNTAGAVTGMLVGLVSSVGLVLVSPNIMGEGALFPLEYPTVVTMPLGFLACYLGARFSGSRREERRALHVPFDEIYVRSATGIKTAV